MRRTVHIAIALGCGALLHACGGSDGDASPVAAAPPPAPVQLALTASNYQGALSYALESANTAFAFAKLGADAADRLFGQFVALPGLIRCPVSGTASIELTDRNRNGALNVSDTVHLFMDGCNSGTNALTGVLRVEVVSAAPILNGREYQFSVVLTNLVIEPSLSGGASSTVNFAGTVNFTRTPDFEHYVVSFGHYDYVSGAETRLATELLVDYLQRYDTLNYDYLIQGTVGGSAVQGQFRVNTPQSLTGIIGAYPSAGRLTLSGGANSTAIMSEEGIAATNGTAVLVSVDANGDGAADAAVPELAWTSLLAPAIFSTLRDQADVTVLPIP
jgi:hypothetical protein